MRKAIIALMLVGLLILATTASALAANHVSTPSDCVSGSAGGNFGSSQGPGNENSPEGAPFSGNGGGSEHSRDNSGLCD